MEKSIENEIEVLIEFCEENKEKISNFQERINKIYKVLKGKPNFIIHSNIEKELVIMRNEAMYGTGEEKLKKLSIS